MHALDWVNVMTHPCDARQNGPHFFASREAMWIHQLDLPEASHSGLQVCGQGEFEDPIGLLTF